MIYSRFIYKKIRTLSKVLPPVYNRINMAEFTTTTNTTTASTAMENPAIIKTESINISSEREINDIADIARSTETVNLNTVAGTEQIVLPKLKIIYHDDCLLHKITDHPEQPDRVAVILTQLKKHYPIESFLLAPLVTDDQILLFHTSHHLSSIKKLFESTESAFIKNNKQKMYAPIDGDTTVMWKTRNAAYRAAGSVVAAIDLLYLPKNHPDKIRWVIY